MRMKLMKNVQSEESTTTVRPVEDSASEVEEIEKKQCKYEQSCKLHNRQGIFLVYANPVCSDF